MASINIPSSFECDCGHQAHFGENPFREMEDERRHRRRPIRLIDSADDRHAIEFFRGQATAVICPRSGRCEIKGWK
jgi:hypothetical protein